MNQPLYSRDELIAKIKDIDFKIEQASAAESYNINSGMSSQNVKRQSLDALIKLKKYWQEQLSEWDALYGCGRVIYPIRSRNR